MIPSLDSHPYATPRLHVRWLPASLAASVHAFWHVTGTYPNDTYEPCYRITPAVLGRFWSAVEGLSRDPARATEVASVVPVLFELVDWVEQRFGPGSFMFGLSNPAIPDPPPESPRLAMLVDRGMNAEEYSRADLERYLDSFYGSSKVEPSTPGSEENNAQRPSVGFRPSYSPTSRTKKVAKQPAKPVEPIVKKRAAGTLW